MDTKMLVRTPGYRFLPPWPSAAQTSMDRLVSALWFRIFPERRFFGPNQKLDQVFNRMHQQPGLAALQLCPFYFDQVTYSLPTATPRESYNLRLRCFDLWADPQEEKRRLAWRTVRQTVGWTAAGRLHRDTYEDHRPNSGIYLNKLCPLQDLRTSGSIDTQNFLFLMYGHVG